MPKTEIVFTIVIFNCLLFIFCTLLDESKIEQLDNTVILKNVSTSPSNFPEYYFARISSDLNSFYVRKISYYIKYAAFNYSHFNNLLRIDSIQDNDLKELNSIVIKENLTESFEHVYYLLYIGDIFLFKNKYNFISLYPKNDTDIYFYSLENKDGKKKLEVFKTDLNDLFGINNRNKIFEELVYYTLSDSALFTSQELQNEGKILIPVATNFMQYLLNNHYFAFLELSIKTIEATRIIFHYKNPTEPNIMPNIDGIKPRYYSLKVFRNRFALFIFINVQTQLYLIIDLKNLNKCSIQNLPHKMKKFEEKYYYFIYNPKLSISNNEIIGYEKIYTLTELSKKNVMESFERDNIESKYLNLNLDLFFFNCYFQTYLFCELMKLNIEGDSSDNSNIHLSVNEKNPLLLIAPYNDKNNIEIPNEKYGLFKKTKLPNLGHLQDVELAEINRKLDEKKKILITKYIVVGKSFVDELDINIGSKEISTVYVYNFFKVYFDLNNLNTVKYTIISKPKVLHLRRYNSNSLFNVTNDLNIIKIYNTSRFLFSYTNVDERERKYKNELLNTYLFVGYLDNNFDSECVRKVYQISDILKNSNFDIIDEIFNNIDKDIKNNEFVSEDDINELNINKIKIGIRFVNCKMENYSYTGLCGDSNIILKSNNEDIKLNLEYYYSTDKLVIKKPSNSNSNECLSYKDIFSYKYDILKIFLDQNNNVKSTKILNSCKIFINYTIDCYNDDGIQENTNNNGENNNGENNNGENNNNHGVNNNDDDDEFDENQDDENQDDENITFIRRNSSQGLNNLFLLLLLLLCIY